MVRPGGAGFHSSGYYHRRLLSYRTYPYGVRCRRTVDRSCIALQNDPCLEVWSVNYPERKVGEEILRRRDTDRKHAEMEFSFDSSVFACTTADGNLVLQCRGHLITEGLHPQYDLFKQWATMKRYVLEKRLGTRFILFGEWGYA